MSAAPPVARRLGAGLASVLVALLALASLSERAVAARGDGIDEYQLKAAFLGSFVKYVSWPAERLGERRQPLVIGVVGLDPFGARLERAFHGRKVDEHPVEVRRFERLEGLAQAHVLFVPATAAEYLDLILRATREAGVLLVGESPGFAADGGMIGFYTEDEKLRFEINNDSAKRGRLKLSSDLLRLARIVADRK